MRQPVRICFFANGRAKPVTGHIFLRENEDGVCRLSVWDSKLNIHETVDNQYHETLVVYFISYLQRFITEWEAAQNAAVEEYARWSGRFNPKQKVGRKGFRVMPMTEDWDNFRRGVTATREGLQGDVTAALKGLEEWGNKSYVRMPRIVFPHPWQETSLTSLAGPEKS